MDVSSLSKYKSRLKNRWNKDNNSTVYSSEYWSKIIPIVICRWAQPQTQHQALTLSSLNKLYLNLSVLGDDALISKGSFMQTKHLCVLIHIWIKVRLAPLNRFKPSSKIFYHPFQGGTSFVDLLFFFLSCVCYVFVCVCLYVFLVTCWERADLLALICGV